MLARRSAGRLLPRCFWSSRPTKDDMQARRSSSLVGKDFLTLKDFSGDEIKSLLWSALDLKHRIKGNNEILQPLLGKTLAMLFQLVSTRTRTSCQGSFSLLGGNAVSLSPDHIHLGVNETVKDTSRVLSRLSDIILARVSCHSYIEEIAAEASVPVIKLKLLAKEEFCCNCSDDHEANVLVYDSFRGLSLSRDGTGLSEMYHPLQALADLQTLMEHFGQLRGLRIAWVGDGTNIIHSLMMAAPRLGAHLNIATPKGYEVSPDVAKTANKFAEQSSTKIAYTYDPREACKDANVIITDTWFSFGKENERDERLKAFAGFKVTKKLTSLAAEDWRLLHCLPRRPEEVEEEVFYSDRSLVWDEAENRKWTVMSVLLNLLKEYQPTISKPNF